MNPFVHLKFIYVYQRARLGAYTVEGVIFEEDNFEQVVQI